MAVDSDIWLTLKAEEKRAKQIMMDLVNESDPTLNNMRHWDGGCLYGITVGLHMPVQYDKYNGKWSVTIEGHTGSGVPPFNELAEHLLKEYPDCELNGIIMNDCGKWHRYDHENEYMQNYDFHVYPEDWEAFLSGDYENTRQGREMIAKHGPVERHAAPTSKPEGEPDPNANNDEDLPF